MRDANSIHWKRLYIEAAAIVVSILLAFVIDAWWEQRHERAVGAEYEQRIEIELREARALLERIERGVQRNIEMGQRASVFFDGDGDSISHGQLIVFLYNMGRESASTFDDSTYDDLIATGSLALIKDVSRRHAIQRAYRAIRDLESELQPYRDEYLAGVRAWIPQKVVDQIREVCTNISEPEWVCADVEVDIDDQISADIIEKLSNDKALLAFRLREQGLNATKSYVLYARETVDVALALFD
jgi:hypothetical protein